MGATIPPIPGLADAGPLTHIEVLEAEGLNALFAAVPAGRR